MLKILMTSLSHLQLRYADSPWIKIFGSLFFYSCCIRPSTLTIRHNRRYPHGIIFINKILLGILPFIYDE
uniref:Uncharacterized protein n=1 Tax=Arundo donax TaxID=35708 RepID=A0A0A9FYF6_ARUDO